MLGNEGLNRLLREQLGAGAGVVGYVGHGSVELWAGSVLTAAQAAQLSSVGLSVIVPLTCLNGYFQDPVGDSLAEALLKAPTGGAVAVWASSGLTETEDQLPIGVALLRQLEPTTGTPVRLGDLIWQAKRTSSNDDIRSTWILFGDPTTWVH